MGEILAAIESRGAAVVDASPGAGKTTRVPPAMLDIVRGEIVVLEPRRLAARLAAARVAGELGEELGETVGYQVRFEKQVSKRTRIRYVTEGVLTRWLMRDPNLEGVGAVVLDELHERHLHSDVALALLGALRKRRELAVVAMSATLEVEPVVALLDAGHVHCAVSCHPVTVEHASAPARDPLDVQVAKAVRALLREGVRGHILVFLPGVAEIRRAVERCAALAQEAGLTVHPLHGSLAAAEQDAAVAPSARQKLIVATNVAESSITIEGIEAVIDSGLVKRASCSPWSGLARLDLGTVSRASAAQRAGRAGRTGSGRCVRLYTAREHERMPPYDEPEIARSDLSEAVLALRLAGVADPRALAWLTPPPAEALARAEALLAELGAVDDGGSVTALARRMARLPVHPRLARALCEAEERDAVDEVAAAAALLSEGNVRAQGTDLWQQCEEARSRRAVVRAKRQLVALSRAERTGSEPDAASLCLLTGFPDRVARRTGAGEELALADGGRAVLADAGMKGMVLVLEATERTGKPALVRSAISIRADWLLDLFAGALIEESELVWSEERARVEQVSRIRYRALVLEESRKVAPPSERASSVLLEAAQRAGLHRPEGDAELGRWLARAAFAGRKCEGLRRHDARALGDALARLCAGCVSLAELGRPIDALELTPEEHRALAKHAPERVRLHGGRELTVVYPSAGEPYVEGFLQDFFGAGDGPRVNGEPLVMHLWGPNRRALQVTRDLASFWDEHYPALQRRLARRYPKHFWPDDPRRAPAKLFKRDAQ
jgi:ATP-dependent helicase HrpB